MKTIKIQNQKMKNIYYNSILTTSSIAVFLFMAILLTSCSTVQRPAPIEYHHQRLKLPSAVEELSKITLSPMPLKKEDIISPATNRNRKKHVASQVNNKKDNNITMIYHEVQGGETLTSIAAKYNHTIEGIAQLNGLYPPYNIDEFQILKIDIPKKKQKDKKTTINSKENVKTYVEEFIAPIKGTIISKFGDKNEIYGGTNKGINIQAKEGTKILASAGGKVIYADYDAIFGYLIIIKTKHDNVIHFYAHLQDISLDKGQNIKAGEVIGYIGQSGKVTKPQLHFGIRDSKVAKNPLLYISAKKFK